MNRCANKAFRHPRDRRGSLCAEALNGDKYYFLSKYRYEEFVRYVVEAMALTFDLRISAMFGGYGIYHDDRIFAISIEGKLYLKADFVSCNEFKVRGLLPLTYRARGKLVTMQYFEAPPELFEDAEAMKRWVLKAYEAAIRVTEATTKKYTAAPKFKRRRL